MMFERSKKIILSISTLIGVSTLISCVKTTDNYVADEGREYMPLTIGKYILYDVDSIYWDPFLKAEIHRHSQQKYTVVDTFRDGAGRISYTINVLSRESNAFPFVADNVIHVTPTTTAIEYNQRNTTLINLIFPVKNNTSWNSAAKINPNDQTLVDFYSFNWTSRYSDVGKPFDNDVKYFNNTATVIHVNDSLNNPETLPLALANKNYLKEIYASGVGLVHRERVFWTYQPNDEYRSGRGVIMKAVEYN